MHEMTDDSKQDKIGWQAAVSYKQKFVDTNVGEYACMSSVKVLSSERLNVLNTHAVLQNL